MNDDLKRKIKDFFFPVDYTCNVCGREIFGGYFCKDCETALPKIEEARCAHCGRKTAYFTERCDSCSGRETYFEKARSVYEYDGSVKKLIPDLKYEGKKYIAEIFGNVLSELYFESGFDCDFCVFVPMSDERATSRGYNHALLIAKEFSRLSGVPLRRDVIVKSRETIQQMRLSREERQENLKGSFAIKNRKEIIGKRVLLIDDVMTTGATAESVCGLLIKNGASSVFVLTVASVQKKRI